MNPVDGNIIGCTLILKTMPHLNLQVWHYANIFTRKVPDQNLFLGFQSQDTENNANSCPYDHREVRKGPAIICNSSNYYLRQKRVAYKIAGQPYKTSSRSCSILRYKVQRLDGHMEASPFRTGRLRKASSQTAWRH